ncbi:MAG: mismatch repair protein MutL, partial [Planctomycetota bacterium]
MIRKLPPAVVNQIAAGEVVERPSSVIKELVENSLDAGARKVRVEITQGGAECMRVLDDGEGFLPEDLPLAFASHATSKLQDVADLDHIGSLGFRGEALASIGAVSRASIKSRRHDHDEAWEVRCDGGVETTPAPCAGPPGTQIEIRDLFFNVPARRRFLKSAHAERARIQTLVAELALARLDVDFTLQSDGKELLRLPADESLAARFARCFGDEYAGGLLPVERSFDGLAIEGLVGEPDLARRDGKLELTFVNGRLARESSALHAVRQAYREYLMGGRFPVYLLHVVIAPDQVDVNIHPRKAEVRFVDARRVAGCMHETVRAALAGRHGAASPGGIVLSPDLPRARSGFPDLPRDLFGGGGVAPASPFGDRVAEPSPTIVRSPERPLAKPSTPAAGFGIADPATAVPAEAGARCASPNEAAAEASVARSPAPAGRANPFARASGRFLQVMDLYLLMEGADGLLVVDQHALHERVVYERLVRAHAARTPAVQRLLVPAVIDVSAEEQAWLLDVRDELQQQGLLLDAFGAHSLAVHGVPAELVKVSAKRLIADLLAEADNGGRRA